MNIEELTFIENRLMDMIDVATGTMEEKSSFLKSESIFDRYGNVHKSYVQLAETGDNLEALKRATFLQWYSVAEPLCYTGLENIEETHSKRAFELLHKKLLASDFDSELKWMLPYYFEIADFYLTGFNEFDELVNYSSDPKFTLWDKGKPSKSSLENRGQLSRYWFSIWEQH